MSVFARMERAHTALHTMTGEDLDKAFAEAKQQCICYIESYNKKLPTEQCPKCGDDGHVPGLRCPACGYRHNVPWAILRDTEWGYEAIPLTNRKKVIREFRVPETSDDEFPPAPEKT